MYCCECVHQKKTRCTMYEKTTRSSSGGISHGPAFSSRDFAAFFLLFSSCFSVSVASLLVAGRLSSARSRQLCPVNRFPESICGSWVRACRVGGKVAESFSTRREGSNPLDKVFFLTYFGFAVASPLPAVYGRRELLDARSPEAAATLTQGPGGTGSACLPGASGGFRGARLPSPRESSVVLSLFLFPNLFSSPSWFSAVCHRGKGVPSFWLVSRSLCPQVEDKGWSP